MLFISFLSITLAEHSFLDIFQVKTNVKRKCLSFETEDVFFLFCTEHLFVRYLGTTINNKEFLRPLMTKKRSSFLQMHAISR